MLTQHYLVVNWHFVRACWSSGMLGTVDAILYMGGVGGDWLVCFTWEPVARPHHPLCNISYTRLRHSVWIDWLLKKGPISQPETSVTNYQPTLCNIPEGRRPQLHRGGSLISHIVKFLLPVPYTKLWGNVLLLLRAGIWGGPAGSCPRRQPITDAKTPLD
jgi:hypothetical protein